MKLDDLAVAAAKPAAPATPTAPAKENAGS